MSEVFDGTVEVQDGSAVTTILLDGNGGDAALGGNGQDGSLGLLDAAGTQRILLDSGTNAVRIADAAGNVLVEVRSNGDVALIQQVSGVAREVLVINANSGTVRLGTQDVAGNLRVHDSSDREVLRVDANAAALYVGANGNEGDIIVRDASGRDVFHFNASNAALYLGAEGNEGDLLIRNGAGQDTIHLDGGQGDIFVRRRIGRTTRNVLQFDASTAALYVGTNGSEGDVFVRDNAGRDVFHMNGENAALYVGANGNEGDIIVRDGSGRDVFHMDGNSAALYIGAQGNEGDLIIRDGGGRDVFRFDSNFAVLDVGAAGNEGDIRVRDDAGNVRIHLDGGAGDIRLHGADCAEHFAVRDAQEVEEGTVLVIGDSGALRASASAYDRRVAGVVSGAGSHRPGIVLDSGNAADDCRPIALAGKVYCKVDAEYGAVQVGDLLTTSATRGHAMRAADPLLAFGAVIGKALAPLATGRGLVPILVALQ